MLPRVKVVTAKPDYQLEITFTNGEVGIYDCRPLLNFGVFVELKDAAYFRQVQAVNGTVAWPHEQDICPDTLYLDSRRPEHVNMTGQ
jgi:hypothetical protein